jgi:hypothetical protein
MRWASLIGMHSAIMGLNETAQAKVREIHAGRPWPYYRYAD